MHPDLKRKLAHYASRDFIAWDHADHTIEEYKALCRTGKPRVDLASMQGVFDARMALGLKANDELCFRGSTMRVKDWAAQLGWKNAELVQRLVSMPVRDALIARQTTED